DQRPREAPGATAEIGGAAHVAVRHAGDEIVERALALRGEALVLRGVPDDALPHVVTPKTGPEKVSDPSTTPRSGGEEIDRLRRRDFLDVLRAEVEEQHTLHELALEIGRVQLARDTLTPRDLTRRRTPRPH